MCSGPAEWLFGIFQAGAPEQRIHNLNPTTREQVPESSYSTELAPKQFSAAAEEAWASAPDTIRAIDQQAAHARRAHFPEDDFLRAGGHSPSDRGAGRSANYQSLVDRNGAA